MNKNRRAAIKTEVINVKINANEEIEYVTAGIDESSQDNLSDGETVEEFEVEDDGSDHEPDVIKKPDGTMVIKMEKETVVEHVCGKCGDTFQNLEVLGKHLKRCRKSTTTTKKIPKQRILNGLPPSAIKESTIPTAADMNSNKKHRKLLCYCCDEEKVSAHKGHLSCEYEYCDLKFHNEASRGKHLFTLHAPTAEFKCLSCPATCPSQGILDLHMETHKALKPFQCENCGRDFTRKYHLERHLLHTSCDTTIPKQELPCNVCGKIFTRIDNLREHLRGHLGHDKKKRDFQCPHCEKSFYGSSLLNIHIRTHTGEKPFPCDLCDKSFASTGALRKHRRTHTGEKPYVCSVCDQSFSAKETLNRHFKLHTGERPHKCQYCDKGFIQITQLQAHLFHHTGENSFECQYCKRIFNRKSRLQQHVKYFHEGSKPFECPLCDKSFTIRSEYNRHVNVHNGIKDFKCNVCQREFSAKASLQAHLQTHVQEEPSICKICHKHYIRADCLVRHVRKAHREALLDIITVAENKKLNLPTVLEEKQESVDNAEEYNDTEEEEDTMDVEEEEEELETYVMEEDEEEEATSEKSQSASTPPKSSIKIEKEEVNEFQPPSMENTIFLDDEQLKRCISALLNLLIDEETLSGFGWPKTSVEDVLSAVIARCGHKPADYTDCRDYTTKMRENTKLLFTVVIDDDSIKSLLNNHTIDEVIIRVLEMSKG